MKIPLVSHCSKEELSPEILKVAVSRTTGILLNSVIDNVPLREMCISCYLQGVADLTETLVNRRILNKGALEAETVPFDMTME